MQIGKVADHAGQFFGLPLDELEILEVFAFRVRVLQYLRGRHDNGQPVIDLMEQHLLFRKFWKSVHEQPPAMILRHQQNGCTLFGEDFYSNDSNQDAVPN